MWLFGRPFGQANYEVWVKSWGEILDAGVRSVGQIAKDFELTETAVRDWVKQAEVDAGERDGLTSNREREDCPHYGGRTASFEESLGLSRERVLGRRDRDVMPSGYVRENGSHLSTTSGGISLLPTHDQC
ncbi:hypothetical protein [Streptomyces sp. NPDC054804]